MLKVIISERSALFYTKGDREHVTRPQTSVITGVLTFSPPGIATTAECGFK